LGAISGDDFGDAFGHVKTTCPHADKTSCLSGAPAILAYVRIPEIKAPPQKIPRGIRTAILPTQWNER